ncbi:MAG: peptidyl-prolyl cis-trans isomerase, partial [Actinomycetota bacterium]|nr:peptidyl-prolyl cis-trans isomerase [Actinomycetota bacterium]
MLRLFRLIPALGAFFVLALATAGCGDSVPSDAVARVGSESIKRTTFDHWMKIAAVSTQGSTGGTAANVSVPQPPAFTGCVANKQRTAPKPAKGQPRPTPAQLKAQCKQEYASLRDQVLQFLISAQWIQGEAADQGIKVSAKEIDTQFNKTKKQSFPKEADFQKFLKDSGMGLADIRFRVRLDTLSNKLRQKVTKGKDKVTQKQIADYYAKNKSRFSQPERRDLRIVLTKTQRRAAQAKAALQGGRSWKSVAREFSIDKTSKAQGGSLLGVAKGQQEQALDKAAFAAPKGKLSGPVKTQFGYYVFQVQKVTPASQQTLKQATPSIRQLLLAQGQQKAIDGFVKDFRKKWKAKTNCRAGFVTQDCKNAPKQKTTATAQPGQGQAPPQQAPPQQAPPQQAPPQ